jgi:hypothetical protein
VMRYRIIAAVLLIICLLGAGAIWLLPPGVPEPAIQTSVIRDPILMEKAWSLPVAAAFGRHVDWQSNASLCGPASIANALRSFGDEIDTESEVLSGTGRCSLGFCFMGLTLDELAEVAKTHHDKVAVLRDMTADQFREELRHANDPARRYIINFDREKIFGAGVGHHSPIGGYLEEEDLVLVLDVNGAFQPWLIERERLFNAMDTLDGERKRGLLLME